MPKTLRSSTIADYVPALETMLKPFFALNVHGRSYSDLRVQVLYKDTKIDGINLSNAVATESMAQRVALWLRAKNYANDDSFRYEWEWGG